MAAPPDESLTEPATTDSDPPPIPLWRGNPYPVRLNWQYYPRHDPLPSHLEGVVAAFQSAFSDIRSPEQRLKSNEVLEKVSAGLGAANFVVERGQGRRDILRVPVLFGRNGSKDRHFVPDAVLANEDGKVSSVLEVEAGQAVSNFRFLKDLFQACVMQDVEYLSIAVRNVYQYKSDGRWIPNFDFETVDSFLETLYASSRLQLPLRGILLIGY